MKAKIIESDRLILKPLSLEHLSQDYVDWLNDKNVNKYLESGGDYSIIKLQDYLIDIEKKDILFWGIHLKLNNLHIGNIKIDPISKYGVAEYGIMLGRKSEWGKGYAKESSLTIIDYCFKKIGLRKITLGVIADNKTAYYLYKNIGFVTEGVYKNHCIIKGKYCDGIRMAIFNPDFHYD